MSQDTDRNFRPNSLDDFTGQQRVRENLRVYVASAKARREPIEHLLFCGPAGLGKTTLAGVVAAEMGVRMVTVNAPSLKTKGELAAVIGSMGPGEVLFLDEIHRLKLEIQELLYPVMEDFKLEVAAGDSHVSVDLPPFTVVGATTHRGLLSKPMRERFGDVLELEPYSVQELTEVVLRASSKMCLHLVRDGAEEVAKRSQGTPRVALRITRRVRDFALFSKTQWADLPMVRRVCDQIGVDSAGLDALARRMLKVLCGRDKPTGLNAVASQLGESLETIQDCVEPFLLAHGYVERHSSGRVATEKARRHIAA